MRHRGGTLTAFLPLLPITSHIEKKATALKAFRSDMFQPVIGSKVIVIIKKRHSHGYKFYSVRLLSLIQSHISTSISNSKVQSLIIVLISN